MTMQLNTIICSTRPNRVGPVFGKWFAGVAREHGKFESVLVDLADFNLPVFDEPEHPRLRRYAHEHTKKWAASVAAADAIVFVTPEYNWAPPPSLVNALSYLSAEWSYKPVGFVSYGGISGGMRSVQMVKQIVGALRMFPVPEGVVIPGFVQQLDASRNFLPNDIQKAGANDLLNELHRVADALKGLRRPA